MRVLIDTSVLIAAMVNSHSAHARALPWLQRIRAGDVTGIVAAHSIAETYAVLTRLPVQPRITPHLAHQVILHNIIHFSRSTRKIFGAFTQNCKTKLLSLND